MKLSKIKLIKISIISIATLIILALITATALFYFFPKKQMLEIITNTIKEKIHRNVSIEDLNYGFGRISLSNITVNKKNKKSSLLKAKNLTIRFSLRSLVFKKKFDIKYISLNNCSINLHYINDKLNINDLINPEEENKKQDKLKEDNQKIDSSIKISKIIINNLSLNISNPPKHLSILNQKFKISTTINIINKDKIKLTNCSLNANSGTLYPEILIDLSEKSPLITGKVKIKNFSLLPLYKWQEVNPLPFQIVNGTVTNLRIKDLIITGKAKANATMSTTNNKLYCDGNVKVNKNNNNIYLINLEGKIGKTKTLVNRLHFNITGKLFDLNLSNSDINLIDINTIVKVLPEKLYGNAKGSIKIKNNIVSADLDLKDVGYDYKQNIASSLNANIKINNNKIKQENINLKILGNDSKASVATLDNNFENLHITIKIPKFVLKEINSKTNNNSSSVKTKKTNSTNNYLIDKNAIKQIPINIQGLLIIDTLKTNLIDINNLKLKYHLGNGNLNINNFRGEIFGGEIEGKANLKTTNKAIAGFTYLHINNIKIQNLAKLKKNLKNRFFGILNAKAKINFSLVKNFQNHTTSAIQFSINKGKLVNTGIQNGLGIWLTDLKYKLKDLEFKKIYGRANVQGKKVTINSFVFNSNDIRLRVKGAFNNKLFAKIPLLIDLEFTKHFIQDLPSPVLLGLTKYKRGNWFSIPFSIAGNLKSSKNLKRLK